MYGMRQGRTEHSAYWIKNKVQIEYSGKIKLDSKIKIS